MRSRPSNPDACRARTGLVLALALATAACGSSARTATGPSPVKCQVSLATSLSLIDASGGTGTVRVATQPECTWTASAEANWISGLSPTSGQGNGQVDFQVPANPAATPRQGDIVVNDNRIRIEQTAAPCLFDVSPRTESVDPDGGAREVTVSTASGCAWSATSDVDWIAFTSPVSGAGSRTVTYAVAQNTGPARRGSLTVAGQTTAVTQAAAIALPPGCTYALRPPTLSVPAAGGSNVVLVIADAGCPWTATSNAPWITITSTATGIGEGTISFSVAANTTGPRTGTLTVAGHIFSVTQASAGACSYAINPTTQSIDAAGGPGTPVAVSTSAGCVWSATSNASWITITSGATGTGNGSVNFTVATNTGGARTGTITIAGETFTLTQTASAGCTYTINPTSQSIDASGGVGTPVAVSTSAGCVWTATSNTTWITITSGASGTGNGSVNFDVATNTGGARTGTITIAGETFTLTQTASASCTYSISPTSQSIGASGGVGTPVSVSTSAGCVWTAASNASWITITSGAGSTGSGSVTFTVGANSGGARSGTLTIAGQTFTVTQAAAPACVYAINPTSQSIGAVGGLGTLVAVSTRAGCEWTASSNATWITVTSGASGSGNGTVTFTAAPNLGGERTGTLTIADQTFTVTQAASPCGYAISPTSDSLSASGGSGKPINVTAPAGCAWTATSNVLWITITSDASGVGNGTVRFSVGSNLLLSRTGTLTIAGQTFTVTQTGLLASATAGTFVRQAIQ